MRLNGAEAILRASVDAGITTCFANPGTTEMPFVAALDATKGLRAVLCLFEGVCTGAADGYGRMAGSPALTLLHLGPGLANGIANLHNAHRAHTPVLNLVGEHATWHLGADPPLRSDIEALARTVCGRVDRLDEPADLANRFADLLASARRRYSGPATVVVPHDVQLADAPAPATHTPMTSRPADVSPELVDRAARALAGQDVVLLLGGSALTARGLAAASRIVAASGAAIFSGGFPARVERGAGLPPVRRLPYFPEQVVAALRRFSTVILVGEREPVAFFGYPGHASRFVRDDQEVITLADPRGPAEAALEALASQIGAPAHGSPVRTGPPLGLPTGAITPKTLSAAIAAVQPEDAVIVDEGATSTGGLYYDAAARSAPHTYLTITGGAIGFGAPCATGAAIACPGRRVISLQADGSAMYTLQALWTQAREACDVTTVLCDNASYRILRVEMERAGVPAGPEASNMVSLTPRLDWVSLARGMAVPAVAVDDAEGLTSAVSRSLAEPGPMLIHARMAT